MISNRLLFKETIKRNIWSVVLASILFFIFMFLPLLMQISISNELSLQDKVQIDDYIEISKISCHGAIYHLFPLIFLAIIMGIRSFSYLHNKKQVDFYHSLPIKRREIFFINYITGIVSIIPIYIISSILLTALVYTLGFGEYISILLVLKNIFWNSIFFILIYSIFNLASILAGNTIISIFLGSFLVFIIPLINLLKILMSNMASYQSVQYISEHKIYDYLWNNPITAMFTMPINNMYPIIDYSLYNNSFNYTKLILIYGVVTVVMIAINYFLFVKRKSEKAGVSIAFDKIKGPLKYLAVITASMYISIFFELITERTIWGIIGILIGCILFHFIAEITYELEFKAIFKNWQSIFGCIFISLGIFFFCRSDLLHKSDIYIPKAEEVVAVDINSYEDSNLRVPLNDLSIIENVIELLNSNYDNDNDASFYKTNTHIDIGYKLKNGKIEYISISKDITVTEDIHKLIYDIYNSEEFILKKDKVINLDIDNKYFKENDIYIHEHLINTGASFFAESGENKNFLQTLQQDIKNNINQDRGKLVCRISFNIYGNDHINNYPIYESYTETVKLLEEKLGRVEDRLVADKIEHIELWDKYSGKEFHIYDKEGIEYILENIEPIYLFNSNIIVSIFYKNNEWSFNDYTFTKDFEEILEHLIENNWTENFYS